MITIICPFVVWGIDIVQTLKVESGAIPTYSLVHCDRQGHKVDWSKANHQNNYRRVFARHCIKIWCQQWHHHQQWHLVITGKVLLNFGDSYYINLSRLGCFGAPTDNAQVEWRLDQSYKVSGNHGSRSIEEFCMQMCSRRVTFSQMEPMNYTQASDQLDWLLSSCHMTMIDLDYGSLK